MTLGRRGVMGRCTVRIFLGLCVWGALQLAACTTVGPGVEAYRKKDYAAAMAAFKADGSAKSHYSIGLMYYKGEGVRADKREAFSWFRRAAEQGFAPAQFSVGVMYYKGAGVERDRKEAASWLRKAAEQGEPKAQFNLGLMYNSGEGVVKDRGEAVSWFRKAARQGHGNAQKILASWGEEW